MEFALIVYLVGTVLPLISNTGGLIIVATIIGVIVLAATLPLWADDEDVRVPALKATKTYLKWALPIAFVCSLVPNKEVSYTMIAAYTAQSIGENEKVQDIAGQSLEVIEAFLEKTKKELETKDVEK
jgi:hypothetical protein